MTKPFKNLRDMMSPEVRGRAEAKTARLLEEMPLNELRAARTLTQNAIAERLGVNQGQVSKIEHRTDMYISTLRKYIAALGGELQIVARFSDGDVRIDQFHDEGVDARHP